MGSPRPRSDVIRAGATALQRVNSSGCQGKRHYPMCWRDSSWPRGWRSPERAPPRLRFPFRPRRPLSESLRRTFTQQVSPCSFTQTISRGAQSPPCKSQSWSCGSYEHRSSRQAPSPDNINSGPHFQVLPRLVRPVDGSPQSPRAKQARSPNDKPSARVQVIRPPAVLACSAVKAIASRMGLRVASHASSGLSPRATSLLCTSARLTVLLVALLSSWGVSLSAPGSRLSTARSAEASNTILFIPGCLMSFGNQLVN